LLLNLKLFLALRQITENSEQSCTGKPRIGQKEEQGGLRKIGTPTCASRGEWAWQSVQGGFWIKRVEVCKVGQEDSNEKVEL